MIITASAMVVVNSKFVGLWKTAFIAINQRHDPAILQNVRQLRLITGILQQHTNSFAQYDVVVCQPGYKCAESTIQ